MFRHVPNALTGLRLVLAIVFFVLLSWYQHARRGDPTLLNIAFFIYLIALVTDYLDGYLARKWNVEGAFGRIVDPFVDKILVLGSFIFFAGKNFVIPDASPAIDDNVVRTITGVTPAMVVILLGRELLITSLRGMGESAGQQFGAAMAGKVKMVLQSITILVILVYVNYLHYLQDHGWEMPARWVRDGFIWLTVIVTLYSGMVYIQRAANLYRSNEIK